MKLLYCRLKGYVGIYHGLGKEEIIIPFSDFKNNLVLIRGKNGYGKSTLLNALSLEPDSSDKYRTDATYNGNGVVFIPYPAEKELHIACGIDIYQILIISPVSNNKRQTTKAYIKKNGEELNPGGNVTTYRELRNSIFDMDPNYIALSMVSSEDRGIVDKSPAERKIFMSGVIGSLDFFNNAYKNLSKKSSACRSQINNIKSKIYNIGDPDNLYATLASSTALAANTETKIEQAKTRIAESNATIKILDPDGEIQNVYTSIVERLQILNSDIKRFEQTLEESSREFKKSHHNDLDIEKKQIEEALSTIRSEIDMLTGSLASLMEQRTTLQGKIYSSTQKLEGLKSEQIKDDIESIIDDLNYKIMLYNDTINNADMDTTLTKSELEIVQSVVNDISTAVMNINDNDQDCITEAIRIARTDVNPNDLIRDLQAKLSQCNSTIQYARDSKQAISANLSIAAILENRPTECTIDSCYFIQEALKFDVKKLQSELDNFDCMISVTQEAVGEHESRITFLQKVDRVYSIIKSCIDLVSRNERLLSRVGSVSKYLAPEAFLYAIEIHHQFNEFADLHDMFTIVDLVAENKTNQEQLITYNADLKVYLNTKTLIEELESSIERDKKELEGIETTISESFAKKKFNLERGEFLSKELAIIETIETSKQQLDERLEAKRQLGEEFNRVKNDIANVKSHVDELERSKAELQSLYETYNPLKASIDQMKFNVSKLESYNQDLLEYSTKYDTIEFLKSACAPSTGIQSVYIAIYMNTTIRIANDLLKYLFGGRLSLCTPEIDNNTFKLPFLDNGFMVPDVSLGSTSQKCMIGMALSVALLSQGSAIYNLLRLDEIDGGLDTPNRMQFAVLLIEVMNIMGIEQCIMCSHNTEIEAYNADVITFDDNGLTFSTTSKNYN